MKEIVIITQDRAGLMADISDALAGKGINIETIDAEDAHDLAVVTMTVDRYNDALGALRDAGFDAVTEDALVIRLPDEPGALAKVARRFKDADINLRSIRIIQRQQGFSLVALAAEKTAKARALVKDYLLRE